MLLVFAENEKNAQSWMKKQGLWENKDHLKSRLIKKDAKYIETGKTVRDAGANPEYVRVGNYKGNRYVHDILNALEVCKAVDKTDEF